MSRVRACIVAYRSGEATVRAARSAADAGAEVLVVLNSPGDGTADLLRSGEPRARIVEAPRNLGFGGGSNLAAAGAETDYLLFLNPDAEIDRAALDALVARLDAHPGEGIAGPALRFPDGRRQLSVRRDAGAAVVLHQYTALRWLRVFAGAWRRYRLEVPTEDAPVAVDVVMGSALLVRTALFRELRGFDPRYFMYYEEADLCRRARERGAGVVFVPGAVATHEGGASARAAPLSLAAHRLVSAERYVLRFSTPARGLLFRMAFLLFFPPRAMFDAVRDLLYALVYAAWPPRHGKVRWKAREAVTALRLLTVDLFRVAAA